jgi:hypothetical protein
MNDGVRYRERVWPTFWVWLLMIGLTATLAIAYGAAYGLIIGVIVFIPSVAIGIGLLAWTSPRLTVTAEDLRAGPARIPLAVLTRAMPLEGSSLSAALRLGDPLLFTLVRTWATTDAVLIEVDDPSDPHTAWLLSTRHPRQLLAALASAGVDAIAIPSHGQSDDAERGSSR